MAIIKQLENRDIARFWSKVDIKSSNECWNWIGTLDAGGYGKLYMSHPKPTTLMAHRVSYFIHNNNRLPDNKIVMHTCDNPSCVNPDHLKMGTQKDNVLDCVKKDRRSPQDGENNHRAILSNDDALKIKDLYQTGKYNHRELGDMFGVHGGTISNIVQGKTWTDVVGDIKIPKNKITNRLSKLDVLNIKEMLNSGKYSRQKVAELMNTSYANICCIANNKTWQNVGSLVDASKIKNGAVGIKIDKQDVIEIKRLLEENILTIGEIAERFNVSASHISSINHGKSWNYVGGKIDRDIKKHWGKKLSIEDVRQIKEFLKEKSLKIKDIAKMFGVSSDNIYHIKQGKIWKNV